MATGQTNKISPRKFSEKIALLNKKEAEGNAEFEEIIKEVQATRSQSACGSLNYKPTTTNQSHDNSQTSDSKSELEKVFENLIECIGQYEQELQGKQQQQQQQQCNSSPNNELGFVEKSIDSNNDHHYHSVVSESTVPTQTISNHHFMKQLPPTSAASHEFNTSFQETYEKINTFDPQTQNISNICGLDTSNSYCRSRVVSVGSADKKNLKQIKQPPRYNSHQSGFANANMYLKPAYDKSWQKSCSDPTLHVDCTPDFNNNDNNNNNDQLNSYSDNILNTQCTNFTQTTNNKSATNRIPFVGQPNTNTFNSNVTNQMIGNTNSTTQAQNVICADKYEYTFENINNNNTNSSMTISNDNSVLRDNNRSVNFQNISTQNKQQHQQIAIPIVSTNDNNMQFPIEHYNINNSNVMNDVPGIKICPIEDDNNQLLRSNIDCLNNNSPHLTDNLSNLPTFNQSQSQSCLQQQADSTPSVITSEPQLFNDDCGQTTITTSGEWLQQIPEIHSSNQQQQPDNAYDSKLNNQINLCPANNNNQLPLLANESSSNNDWSSNSLANDSSLNVPKVNNLLSLSECGLTNCYDQRSGELDSFNSNSSNNIIRSHSHNSIDYMSKQTKICKNNHSINQNYHNQAQIQLLNQYDNPMDQFRLQIGNSSSGRYCSQSVCSMNSMKPQQGSISPLDSSSNLTSPQSEQNSPGIEYKDPFSLSGGQINESYTHPVVSRPPLQYGSHDALLNNNQNNQQASLSTNYVRSLNQQAVQINHQQAQQTSQFQQELSLSTQGSCMSLIGPCQSPSSSRRAHNQVCRGTYSSPPTSRGPAGKS